MKTESGNIFLLRLMQMAVALLLIANNSFAQRLYKVEHVAKVELIRQGGGLSSDLLQVEVVRGSGGWESYRANSVRGHIKSSSREFIKNVAEEELNHLLALVAKGESAKNIEQFGITSSALVPYIDSLDINIPSISRRAFIELLRDESIVQQAFNNVTKPFVMDDRTRYGISFLMKDGSAVTMEAYSFADLYYLPWQTGAAKSYDPAISIVFESLLGNDAFATTEKQHLNRRLVQDVYWKHLHKK